MDAVTGVTVDVNRFSLHDGPGIRTTVFLKGCPLHCTWCHNPEAILPRPQLSFNPDKCINCFRCVEACHAGVHSIVAGRHQVDFSRCELSEACVAACPEEALSIIGGARTVNDIMAVVLRDREYYARSGGGVTVSGGEPMAQFEFTRTLLRACKAESLHTAVETCGHARPDHYSALLPLTDLWLFDYKETDSERHRHYTGVGNAVILKNLDKLYRSGARVRLRCPLIPGVNDTGDHFRGIRDLSLRYPALERIEIMPYHNIGLDKARRIGTHFRSLHLETVGKELRSQWRAQLDSLGCTNVTVG